MVQRSPGHATPTPGVTVGSGSGDGLAGALAAEEPDGSCASGAAVQALSISPISNTNAVPAILPADLRYLVNMFPPEMDSESRRAHRLCGPCGNQG